MEPAGRTLPEGHIPRSMESVDTQAHIQKADIRLAARTLQMVHIPVRQDRTQRKRHQLAVQAEQQPRVSPVQKTAETLKNHCSLR